MEVLSLHAAAMLHYLFILGALVLKPYFHLKKKKRKYIKLSLRSTASTSLKQLGCERLFYIHISRMKHNRPFRFGLLTSNAEEMALSRGAIGYETSS